MPWSWISPFAVAPFGCHPRKGPLPFILAVVLALAILVVIPKGDLLLDRSQKAFVSRGAANSERPYAQPYLQAQLHRLQKTLSRLVSREWDVNKIGLLNVTSEHYLANMAKAWREPLPKRPYWPSDVH